jgi:hypothetical protein
LTRNELEEPAETRAATLSSANETLKRLTVISVLNKMFGYLAAILRAVLAPVENHPTPSL